MWVCISLMFTLAVIWHLRTGNNRPSREYQFYAGTYTSAGSAEQYILKKLSLLLRDKSDVDTIEARYRVVYRMSGNDTIVSNCYIKYSKISATLANYDSTASKQEPNIKHGITEAAIHRAAKENGTFFLIQR